MSHSKGLRQLFAGHVRRNQPTSSQKAAMRPPKQHTCAIVCSDQEPGSERERERASGRGMGGEREGEWEEGEGREGGREQKQQGGRGEFERGAPRNLVKRAWCGVPSPWCLAVKVSGIYPNVQARPAVRRYMNQFQPKHYAKSDQWSVSSYSCVRINMCIMWSIVNGQHLLMNVCKPHVAVEEAVAENAGKKHHLHALVTVYDDSYSYLTCKTTAGSAIAVSMPTGWHVKWTATH